MEELNEKITNANILIIDEDVNMMEILTSVLNKYGHNVKTFSEPISAIQELKENYYDILIVNYLMSPVNGDKIVELVRDFNKEIYIILMSMHRDLAPSIETMKTLDIQAYFEKSSRFDQLILSIQSGIKYIEQLRKIKNMNLQLERYLLDFAKILLSTIGAKDHYTEGHSKRVAKLCVLLSQKIGLSKEETELLHTAAYFHDVGKIGVSDNILLKNGKLTDEEYEIMKLHTIIGSNIFKVTDIFKDISPIIKYHHERYDGKGYPEKLKGENIPKLSRVLSICDSFDAMVSKRSYKETGTADYALSEINNCAGKQFDPVYAKAFLELYDEKTDEIIEIMNSERKEDDEK